MKTKVLAVAMALLLFALACGPLDSMVERSIALTQTAAPTATATLQPTNTPAPTKTATPVPTEVTSVKINDVVLKIVSASVHKGPVTLGANKMTPNTGYQVMVIEFSYTGDAKKMMESGALSGGGVFFVRDSVGYANWGTATIDLPDRIRFGFFVPMKGPFQLVITLGSGAEIDLTPFLKK